MKLFFIIVIYFIIYINAEVLWELDIKKGCKNFQHINLDGNESRCESNKNYLKLIKPKNNNRAEIHGIKNITFNKKSIYYISWNFMIDNSVTNNAIVIKTINNNLVLEQYQPNKKLNTLFKYPIEKNKWYNQTIGIYVSDKLNNGYIEYWFEGKKRKLYKNSTYKFKCRTFDGSYVDSKWGIYGAYNYNYNSYINNIKITTKYDDIII